MALSRVWSYLIIFSIAVACYHYIRGDRNIFSDLVTERKLQGEESFPRVAYYDLTHPVDTTLESIAGKLQAANWQAGQDPFRCKYIVTGPEGPDARPRLESAIRNLRFARAGPGGNFQAGLEGPVYFHGLEEEQLAHADSLAGVFAIESSGDIFSSATVVTRISNTDSLRLAMLAAFAGQQVIAAGDVHYFLPKNIDGIFETGKFAIIIVIGLIGTLALFMGLLNVAERAGGISLLSRFISPFLSRLFPDIPKGHASFGHMVMNFSANLLGLDNAATPFGLKAMQSLQELNTDKDRATNAQIMFLALHASGLTLIPVSIIAVRAANGSLNPNEIFIPLMLSTFICTMTAMLVTSLKQRINLLHPKLFFPVFTIAALLGLFVWFLTSLQPYALELFSDTFSNGAILLVFLGIIAGGLYKKINIFEAFVDGAKGGFETAVRIIPYLVGMLVAVSMLRTSGAFDLIIDPIKSFIAWAGLDTRFAEGLPTAFLRPFSAGGARGFMIDAMRTYGPDSFIGKLVCVLQGSSETTFYVVALYFGSVSIKNTRYSIPVMLLADLVGVIFSISFAYFMWG